MTIKEYYENYNTNKKLNITLPINTAVTVKDFYNNCIKYNMLPLDSVIAWHNMFMEYIEIDDAIFWVRYYESGSKKTGRWNTRRGCKTQFRDGFSYVFVSNFDAHEIFNMVRLGVKPDANEFLDLMKNNKFPLHYDSGKSCEESDIAPYSFPQIGSTRGGILTPDHWYLAHIIGVKSDYIDLDGNVLDVNVDRLYPRGEVADWKLDSNGKMVRYIDDTLSQEEKALVKAHFLRFVDPLNYYAAPGQNYQNNSAAYNIGEAQVVNDYIGTVFSDIYGHVNMKEFRKQALASDELISDESAEINAEFGNPILSDKVKSKPSKTVKRAKYSEDKILEIAVDYLRNGTSMRELEVKHLGIKQSGGVAMKILMSLGIAGAQKGMLKKTDMDTEIAKADGILKDTLVKIKEKGL